MNAIKGTEVSAVNPMIVSIGSRNTYIIDE
jgi:hypothetical protein